MTTDTSWALREQVWVTLIDRDDDLGLLSFLIQRQPNSIHKAFPQQPEHFSFVLTFIQESVCINGEKVDLGTDLPGYRMLTGAVSLAPEPQIGKTVSTYAGPREEWLM